MHIRMPLAQYPVNSFVGKHPPKDPHHVDITEDRNNGRLGEGILRGTGPSFPLRPRNEIPELFTFQNLIGRAIATMLANAKLSGIKVDQDGSTSSLSDEIGQFLIFLVTMVLWAMGGWNAHRLQAILLAVRDLQCRSQPFASFGAPISKCICSSGFCMCSSKVTMGSNLAYLITHVAALPFVRLELG